MSYKEHYPSTESETLFLKGFIPLPLGKEGAEEAAADKIAQTLLEKGGKPITVVFEKKSGVELDSETNRMDKLIKASLSKGLKLNVRLLEDRYSAIFYLGKTLPGSIEIE